MEERLDDQPFRDGEEHIYLWTKTAFNRSQAVNIRKRIINKQAKKTEDYLQSSVSNSTFVFFRGEFVRMIYYAVIYGQSLKGSIQVELLLGGARKRWRHVTKQVP